MLIDAIERRGGDWVFTAPPGADASVVELEGGVRLHPIPVDEGRREQHYDTVSVEFFLGVLHHLHDTSVAPVVDDAFLAAWSGYEQVNELHAKRLTELLADDPDAVVLVNDPHLMLVPDMLGRPRGGSTLVTFLGTPWCGPDTLEIVPRFVRDRVLRSLLRSDALGFHSSRWVEAFLACCRRFLPEAIVEDGVVSLDDHACRVVAAPFPLDVGTVERLRDDEETLRRRAQLERQACGRRIVVRAERLDLWKNVLRGFLAHEIALDRDPGLARRCWFLAVLTSPSRANARHRAYEERVREVVDRINARHGTAERPAVTVVRPDRDGSRHSVVAALMLARAALVNSTWDGLNLFAKEAAYLLGDDAVLLLSRTAGAFDELGAYAVALDAFDVGATADALARAVSEERHPVDAGPRRAAAAAGGVEAWIDRLTDR